MNPLFFYVLTHGTRQPHRSNAHIFCYPRIKNVCQSLTAVYCGVAIPGYSYDMNQI